MSTDLSRAQSQYDAQLPPSCYESEPQPTLRELHDEFWDTITTALNRARLNVCCESLSRPALTHEWSSVDVALGCIRECEREVIAALREAADAGEKWLEKNGPLQ